MMNNAWIIGMVHRRGTMVLKGMTIRSVSA